MLNEYINSSESLVSFIKNAPNPWAIKDIEKRIIYCNKFGLMEHNLPENFNIEGKFDKDIPSQPCQELWEEFDRDDQKVITENKRISGVEIAYYGKGNNSLPTPNYFEKYPLFDDNNKIIGLVYHANKIDTPTLLCYMSRFKRKTIQFDAPNNTFTKRELEVIFWAQQRLSAKEISKRLGISDLTVEKHLTAIYKKAGVHSGIQLIEYCKNTGLDNYIPSNFVKNGIILIS